VIAANKKITDEKHARIEGGGDSSGRITCRARGTVRSSDVLSDLQSLFCVFRTQINEGPISAAGHSIAAGPLAAQKRLVRFPCNLPVGELQRATFASNWFASMSQSLR
jgi:hypothetical protein